MTMTQLALDFDTAVLSALRKGPKEFAQEVKTATVVEWYAAGRISRSKAAEFWGVSRAEYLAELHRRKVPACQVDIGELREEIRGV